MPPEAKGQLWSGVNLNRLILNQLTSIDIIRLKVRNTNRKSASGTATVAKDLTTTVYEPIQPKGLVLALMVVTIVFTAMSSFFVLLRVYVRVPLGLFSVEDLLTLAGWTQ
ncbi:hypothetical protein J3F84DRAFT_353999 [Trichoderma pleuroticola]